MIAVVAPHNLEEALERLIQAGETATRIGRVVARGSDEAVRIPGLKDVWRE